MLSLTRKFLASEACEVTKHDWSTRHIQEVLLREQRWEGLAWDLIQGGYCFVDFPQAVDEQFICTAKDPKRHRCRCLNTFTSPSLSLSLTFIKIHMESWLLPSTFSHVASSKRSRAPLSNFSCASATPSYCHGCRRRALFADSITIDVLFSLIFQEMSWSGKWFNVQVLLSLTRLE